MSEIDDLIRDFADDVPHYLSTAIVDMESGLGVDTRPIRSSTPRRPTPRTPIS